MLITQLCLILCDPVDCSPPGSNVHGIIQARLLEWVAIPFSGGSSWPRDWTQVFCVAGWFFAIWATTDLAPSKKIVPIYIPSNRGYMSFWSSIMPNTKLFKLQKSKMIISLFLPFVILWGWTSFPVFIGHSYLFLCELPIIFYWTVYSFFGFPGGSDG